MMPCDTQGYLTWWSKAAALFSPDAPAAARFSHDTVTMFYLAVPHMPCTNHGSVVGELGCAHVAGADYTLISSPCTAVCGCWRHHRKQSM